MTTMPTPDAAPSLDSLPSPNTKRWVARRKAAVVAAVANGVLTLEEACRRYMLSAEEFASWQRAIEAHGLRGLRTTRIQEYRSRETAEVPAAKTPRREAAEAIS
ncbi:MAG: DUF1153 domain-containing protein [Alphaproteobacteria bacterium]